MCGVTDVGGCVEDAAGSVVSAIADTFGDKVIDLFEAMSSFWVKVPAPEVGQMSADGSSAHPTGAVAWIWEQTEWYAIALAMLGLMVGACRLMIMHRGEDLQQLMHDLLRFVLTVSLGLPSIILLTAWSDEAAEGIIESAMGVDPDEGLSAMLGIASLTQAGSAMIFVLGTVALLVSLFQIAVLIIRGGMLVLVVGFLPIAAAGMGTQTGRQMHPKLVGWILAFILYKPVAALIFGAGMVLIKSPSFGGNEDNVMLSISTGLAIVAMSVLALPALMKLCVPAVAAAAGGRGAGMFLAAGAGTAVATGALLAGGGAGAAAGSTAARLGTSQAKGWSGGGGSGEDAKGADPNPGGSPGSSSRPGSQGPNGSAEPEGSAGQDGDTSASSDDNKSEGSADSPGTAKTASPMGSGQESTTSSGRGPHGASDTGAAKSPANGSSGVRPAGAGQSGSTGSTGVRGAEVASDGVSKAAGAASDEIEGAADPDGSK